MPIVALLLIALAVGGWFIYQSTRNNAAAVALTEQFEWEIDTRGGTTTPTSNVVLYVAGVALPIGDLPGACKDIEDTEHELLENELTGIICTKPDGTGMEIGIFEETQGLVMKLGQVQGTERTNFTQLSEQTF